MEQDLAALAARLSKEIGSLPLDSEGRPIQITIGGNNAGNISLGGTQITIQPSPIATSSYEDASEDVLRENLRHYKAEYYRGWLAFWFNVPTLMMICLLASLTYGIFSGAIFYYSKVLHDTGTVAALGIALVMMILGNWMSSIRRFEGQYMAESRAAITQIEAALRRRRAAARRR